MSLKAKVCFFLTKDTVTLHICMLFFSSNEETIMKLNLCFYVFVYNFVCVFRAPKRLWI